jgi:hypothetical protein
MRPPPAPSAPLRPRFHDEEVAHSGTVQTCLEGNVPRGSIHEIGRASAFHGDDRIGDIELPAHSALPDSPPGAWAEVLTRMGVLDSDVEDEGFADVVGRISALAVQAVPGAGGAGLTLLKEGRPDTTAATADFAHEVEAIQYALGEGPSITATVQRRTVHSGSLATERQWPRFARQANRLGVHSALSLPLVIQTRVAGTVNVYAHPGNAFDERSIVAGEAFARSAAAAVDTADVRRRQSYVAAMLQSQLATRREIDRAVGAMMARYGCAAEDAGDFLRAIARFRRETPSDVAVMIINDVWPSSGQAHQVSSH